jgi:hypothetical protein
MEEAGSKSFLKKAIMGTLGRRRNDRGWWDCETKGPMVASRSGEVTRMSPSMDAASGVDRNPA